MPFRCNDICKYLKLPKFQLHSSEVEGKLKSEIETTLAGLTKIETAKRRADRLASDSSFDSGRYSLPSSIVKENFRLNNQWPFNQITFVRIYIKIFHLYGMKN